MNREEQGAAQVAVTDEERRSIIGPALARSRERMRNLTGGHRPMVMVLPDSAPPAELLQVIGAGRACDLVSLPVEKPQARRLIKLAEVDGSEWGEIGRSVLDLGLTACSEAAREDAPQCEE